jgi:mannose-6-phosphate isomerase-like protein (cupin superfamily)
LTLEEVEMVAIKSESPVISLKTPLLKSGRLDNMVISTDQMTVVVKVYAEGGENMLHTHPREDHAFVILRGSATFFGEEGEIATLRPHQAFLARKGQYYRFHASGDEPLVMLRVGGTSDSERGRVGQDGGILPEDLPENRNHLAPQPLEGQFFE